MIKECIVPFIVFKYLVIYFSGNISFCIESIVYHNFKSTTGVNILDFLKFIFLTDFVKITDLVKIGDNNY